MLELIVTAWFVCVLLVLGAGACAGLWDRPAVDLDYQSPNIPRGQERDLPTTDELIGWLADEGECIGALEPEPVLAAVRAKKHGAGPSN